MKPKPPNKVLAALRAKGFKRFEWSLLIDPKIPEEDQDDEDLYRWFGYAEKDGKNYAITVATVTGMWTVEVLNSQEHFHVYEGD